MRSIIIEDEQPSRDFLKELLDKFCEDIEVVEGVENIKDAVKAIQKHQPDLVFLDIELPGQDGFALFDYFDTIDFGVIFTTAYNEYAIKAIRASAIDYLVKPIDLDELQVAIERARMIQRRKTSERVDLLLSNISHNRKGPMKLALPLLNGFVFVKLDELLYCKAEGRYTNFHLIDGSKKLVSKPMKEYEDILLESGFLKIHRSHIINAQRIHQYTKGKHPIIKMEDGSELVVALSRKEELERKLNLS